MIKHTPAEPSNASVADGAASGEGPKSHTRSRRAYLPASERRARIIEAAQGVFARSSLQGARTRELAKAANINQATLFEHFESKEALFTAAVVEPLIEVMQGMRERAAAYREATSPEEMRQLGADAVARHLDTMRRIYPLLASALFSDPETGSALYREHIAPMLAARGAVMRGVTRDDVDPEMLALAAFGAFFAVAMDQHFRGRDDDVDAIAERLSRLMSYGFVRDELREPASPHDLERRHDGNPT